MPRRVASAISCSALFSSASNRASPSSLVMKLLTPFSEIIRVASARS
ncbi:hypothetical protein ACN28S_03505 [Cystobacter fuscus]